MDDTIKVRVAGPSDEDDLVTLCRLWYGEEGQRGPDGMPLPFCVDTARTHIRARLVAPAQLDAPVAMCGIVGEPGALEASICVEATSPWCSRHYYLNTVWHYVHPEFRDAPHGRALVAFSQSVSNLMRTTLELRASAMHNLGAAKEKFIARQGGVERSGAIFLYHPSHGGVP